MFRFGERRPDSAGTTGWTAEAKITYTSEPQEGQIIN
jgi:hypothetical protein